ncbi:MAG: sensor histidine kinase [Thermaerobacter sp.]|nr:sensor histidine kinase [Thermaerobacter sp.]
MNYQDDRARYRRLKLLTIAGPTLFVAAGETVRQYLLQAWLAPTILTLLVVAVTLVGSVLFSWYVFRVLEQIETERRAYKDAMLSLQERERIAREMHDGVAQNLAVLNLQVHKLTDDVQTDRKEAALKELEQIREVVQDSFFDVRQSLFDLKATRRLQEGFWPAVEKQLHEFEKHTAVTVNFHPLEPAEDVFNELTSVQVLRIVQESLTNIRKHAGAHSVTVACERQGSQVQFVIMDDGRGFQCDKVDRSLHFGLSVMRERAESIGGTAEIVSQPGEGTKVTIMLPVLGRRGEHGKSKAHVGG